MENITKVLALNVDESTAAIGDLQFLSYILSLPIEIIEECKVVDDLLIIYYSDIDITDPVEDYYWTKNIFPANLSKVRKYIKVDPMENHKDYFQYINNLIFIPKYIVVDKMTYELCWGIPELSNIEEIIFTYSKNKKEKT